MAGFIVSIILFELFLNFAVFFIPKTRIINSETSEQRNLLFMGDSFTYGVMVAENQTFPSYVEQMLNSKYPGQNFRSINKGLPGANTYYIVQNLEKNIKEFNPEAVFILAGINNYTNLTGFHLHSSLKEKILNIIKNTAVYRFLSFLINPEFYEKNPRINIDRAPISSFLISQDLYLEDIYENPQINLSLKTENLIPEKFNLKSDIFFNSLDPSTLNINKKGYELLSNFDYLKAESSFSENPLDEYDYAGLILAQNFLFDFEKAFDTADKGLKLFNNSIAIANAVFATCIYSNSNFEKYYNLLENSLNNFKGDLCSLFFASIINKYSSNLNNSEKWEKKIFELKPDDSIYAILEAILALKQDNTVKAIEILNSSIQKSPYYADNYVFLTDLLIETGNFEEADSIISKLENLFPDFYKLFYIKSAYYYNVNSKEFKNKTAEYINKMIELNPGLFNKCKILNEEKVFLLKEIMNISLNIGSFEWIIEKIKNQNNFSEIMDKPSFFFNNFLLITSLLKGNTNDSKYFSNQIKNYTSELAGQNSLLPFYFINQLIDYDFIIEAQSQLDNIFSFFDLLDYQNQILTYELAVKLSLKNQDFTKAADYYEKLMNLTPQEKHILIEQIENLYLTDYVTNKNNSYEKLMDFYKRNNLSEKLNDIENRLPEKSYENKISEWILSDVEKIVHICRDYNVPVYFMNYFRVNYDFIKKNVENYDNVYFIDNYNHFNNTISKTYSNTDNLFFYDGHLTADGNRLKADYIVNNLQFNN